MDGAILRVMDKWERQAATLREKAAKLSDEPTLTLRDATIFLAEMFDECRRELSASIARRVVDAEE